MGIRKWLSNKMMTLGVMGTWGLGLILHVWTTLLTFFSYGFEASIFAFIFPIVAEFFGFLKLFFIFRDYFLGLVLLELCF